MGICVVSNFFLYYKNAIIKFFKYLFTYYLRFYMSPFPLIDTPPL